VCPGLPGEGSAQQLQVEDREATLKHCSWLVGSCLSQKLRGALGRPGVLGTAAGCPKRVRGPVRLHSALSELTERECALLLLSGHLVLFVSQQNEAKLDEILKEIKSIKETICSQDERISKLEQQLAKMAA
jgi:hypothetical protein